MRKSKLIKIYRKVFDNIGFEITNAEIDCMIDYGDTRTIIFTPRFIYLFTTKYPAFNMCNILQNLNEPMIYLYKYIVNLENKK